MKKESVGMVDAFGVAISFKDREMVVALQDEADAIAAARHQVTGEELQTFAYEFPGSDGRMHHGLAIGGVGFLFEYHFKRIATFTDMQVHVSEVPQEDGRVFTVGITCHDPKGNTATGLCSTQERPCKRGSTIRYFNKHAAPIALSCAKRNAMRDLLPRAIRTKFLKEVLDAKHGVGRVESLRPRRLAQRRATDEWLVQNSELHKLAGPKYLDLDKDRLHRLMEKSETKHLKRPITDINQLSVGRMQVWVQLLEIARRNPVQLRKLEANVAKQVPGKKQS
ncbi:hypothetical protein LCGC14_0441490 [marine sediment metagenome]|uniref:Uncharacterized protein n=1 Tax=marine sediment metagenome TaxID=412755 RepID=A0A0F9T3K6_9ZZZZ